MLATASPASIASNPPVIPADELARQFNPCHARFDTELTEAVIHETVAEHLRVCEADGTTPIWNMTTSRHAAQVYRIMARNYESWEDPSGRQWHLNSLNISEICRKARGSIHRKYVKPAISLLLKAGVVSESVPWVDNDGWPGRNTIAVDVEPSALVDAHEMLLEHDRRPVFLCVSDNSGDYGI